MQAPMTRLLEILYLAVAVGLAIYGFHALWLTWLRFRHGEASPRPPQIEEWPQVTVQLPLFNELHVAQRLLRAVARLDYPRDRLQVLVLDDSTDETTALVARRVADLQEEGLDIHLLHRRERRGFKAGALQEALARTKGEIVVLFDADFLPPRDYLRRVVPFFVADPRLGCIQTRWEHLNRDFSLLTRAQALALDGHFAVEQVARNRAGLFMAFNGTAGAWRRACIEDGGGWQADTLCEDLDLSYRAQLRGWRFLFLPEVAAPAELPAQMAAFKRQQFRWAKGSVQVLRKLGGAVLRAQRPWPVRLAGLLHLGGYLVHPLMLALLLLSLPLFLLKGHMPLPFAFLSLASAGPPLLYALGQWTLHPAPQRWWRGYRVLPALMALGVGIAWNNTVAVLEALLGRPTPFRRTPKFNLAGRAGNWTRSRYALRPDWTSLVEALLGVYALGVVWAAAHTGNWLAVPFFALYAWGFFYVSLADLVKPHLGQRARPRLTPTLPSAPSLPVRRAG